MAVIYSTGFENAQSVADLRSQGWVNTAPATATQRGVPWIAPRATYDATKNGYFVKNFGMTGSTSGLVYPGNSGGYDTGYYNTGTTIAALWASGGFAFGIDAVFTPPWTILPYFGISTSGGTLDSFNGKVYGTTGDATSALYVSSDNAMSFSLVAGQPAATGLFNVTRKTTNTNDPSDVDRLVLVNNAQTGFSVTTDGTTWASRSVTLSNAFVGLLRGCYASAAYRQYVFALRGPTSNQLVVINNDLITGTTSSVSVGSNTYQVISAHSPDYASCPYVAVGTNGGGLYIASQDANLASQGSWINRSSGLPISRSSILYWGGSRWWIGVQGSASFYYNTNADMSGSWTTVTAPGVIYSIVVWNGLLIASGAGVIYTSTNFGLTWTTNVVVGSASATANAVPFGYEFHLSPDGELILVNSAAYYTGLLKTSDGYVWRSAYSYGAVNDMTDANIQTIGGYSLTGIYSTQPPNPSTNVLTINTSTPVFGFQVGARSGSTRNLFIYYSNASTTPQATVAIDATVPSHYIELVATAAGSGTGSVYGFTLAVHVDGLEVWNSGATVVNLSATAGDVAIINLSRYSNIGYDGVYLANKANPNPGPLGPITIIGVVPSSDSAATWTKTPAGAASNAVAAAGPALSQTSRHYVSASMALTDEYGHSALSGTNTVLNVSVQGYYTQSNGTGAANLSVKQGGTTVVTSNTSVPSGNSVYVKKNFDAAPDGTTWDITKVNGTTIVNSKVS